MATPTERTPDAAVVVQREPEVTPPEVAPAPPLETVSHVRCRAQECAEREAAREGRADDRAHSLAGGTSGYEARVIDVLDYEGASGDVDEHDFGPIYVQHRVTGVEVLRGIGGVRDGVFEVTELEVADGLTQDDVVALFVLVYLFDFADDYWRGKVERVSLVWADGSKTVTFNYPAPITS